tara:strand:- start:2821 stop:3036 length:216 start_codon:yes stop_codon:yes gene_type:complete
MAIYRIEYTRTIKDRVEIEASDLDTAWSLIKNGGMVYEGDGKNVIWSEGISESYVADNSQEITVTNQTNPT